MLSIDHEILVNLFKNRPSLAAEILDEVLDVPIPDYTEARIALGKTMKGYQYQSEFAKRYVAEGEAQSVLKVLKARGLAVPDDVRERILAQKDPERLDRWLEKAIVASSVAEVVDETN